MRAKVFLALALALAWCVAAQAQMPPSQPLTFVSDYTVKPGKEEEFMNLVKAVGAPVRDKLMAEGVILAWGIDVPAMRAPGQPTHSIWYSVADWGGIETVQKAMAAQIEKMRAEDKKAAEGGRKGGKVEKSFDERVAEVFDASKTKDWVFRDLAAVYGSAPPPAGLLPYSRIFLISVKPGKYDEWRAAFDKYVRPTLDKQVADGTIGAWGLGIEEVKTSGEFTHFVWASYPNLAAAEKLRNAFVAVGAKRSAEENEHIAHVFASTADPNAARSFILRAIIFKVGGPPKK